MTSSPTPPDPSQGATDLGNGGNLPNPQAPSWVGVGFPSGAVALLRSEIDVGGSIWGIRQSLVPSIREVLAWIDRYVPQSLVGSEETVVVDGIRELRFNGDEALLDMLDLVRVNGRPFVPETPAIVDGEIVEDLETRGYALGVEAAASLVDQCNREGPYNAIGAAERIRALLPEGTGDFRRLYTSTEWPLTPPVNHEAANRERAGVTGKTLFERMSDIARAARPAFACPQCGYDVGHPGTSREGVCVKCGTAIVVELNDREEPVALARRSA